VTLLDNSHWTGSILLEDWAVGAGGTYPVVEPATGATLTDLGLAAPGDVARATATAARAQRGWAALPHTERAAVLRRAGDLVLAHAEEITEWLVRESGSTRGKAAFEIHTASQECYEAAALAGLPFGEVLRSSSPRLSLSRQVPIGVVGVIAPFNVPIILSIRAVAPALALGNAVVLKPDPRTAFRPEFSGRSVLAYDAPGCGETEIDDLSLVSVPFLAQAAVAMLDRYDIDRFRLVGHSMGGLTSLLLADQIPDRVLSFIDIECNLAPEDCFLSRQIISHDVEDDDTG
jgi:hypothetical protein